MIQNVASLYPLLGIVFYFRAMLIAGVTRGNLNSTQTSALWFIPIPNIFHELLQDQQQLILSKQYHKDLGIVILDNLSWSDHYATGYLACCVELLVCQIATKKLLHISLVRLQLTYCSPVWRPHLIKILILLERVQRHATKFILNNYVTEIV